MGRLQVRRLPPGTVAAVSVGEERLQGRVEKPLVGGGAASDTWTNRVGLPPLMLFQLSSLCGDMSMPPEAVEVPVALLRQDSQDIACVMLGSRGSLVVIFAGAQAPLRVLSDRLMS